MPAHHGTAASWTHPGSGPPTAIAKLRLDNGCTETDSSPYMAIATAAAPTSAAPTHAALHHRNRAAGLAAVRRRSGDCTGTGGGVPRARRASCRWAASPRTTFANSLVTHLLRPFDGRALRGLAAAEHRKRAGAI